MSDGIEVDSREVGKVSGLLTGKKYQIKVKTKFSYHIVEMEDVHFHFDSAVLLPDYKSGASDKQEPDPQHITGLKVLYTCYKFLEENSYKKKILVTGHTDKKGSESYNLDLSQKRAENVFYMFTGKRINWIDSSFDKHKIEDIQQILKWISITFQYDCDPGPKTNSLNSDTESAILKFQQRYNQDFVILKVHKDKFSRIFIKIDENGKMDKPTWGAFFDLYELELINLMGITEDGLKDVRSKLEFVEKNPPHPAPVVGCGEFFPASKAKTENENPVDRRVEILFFDDDVVPVLKCTPQKLVCYPKKCDLYNSSLFKRIPIPVKPIPPPNQNKVKVFLKFSYQMPDRKNRSFPKEFPVTVVYKDKTEEPPQVLDDNSRIKFEASSVKESFGLRFDVPDDTFVATPPPDKMSNNDELISLKAVVDSFRFNDLLEQNYRFFLLPKTFTLKTADWLEPKSTSNYNNNTKEFEGLNNAKNIGSDAAPIEMVLNPHWQFLRFEFFDRFFGHSDHNHKRIGTPSIMLQGFRDKKTASGKNSKPDTQSNWMLNETDSFKSVQALPWIIQKKIDGTDDKKPDLNVLIQFKTSPNTFIESIDAKSRKIKQINDDDKLKPSSDRLKFYDLPELWKSTKYFTRLDKTTGKLFEELTNDEISNSFSSDKPLVFCLDDIVLTDNKLHKHLLGAHDLVTIFFHQFKKPSFDEAKPISDEGVYNPGTKVADFFPFSDIQILEHCYIADYPDWVRLIICQGNLFDVFNKRTSDTSGNDIVGARAAVRWVDGVSAGVPVHSTMDRRPDRKDFDNDINKRFFSIQPFFSQEDVQTTVEDLKTGTFNELDKKKSIPTFPGFLFGRFDIILLRCCDVIDSKEFALNMRYCRYHPDYSKAPKTFKDENGKVITFDKDEYSKNLAKNIVKRWNGPDQASPGNVFNSGNLLIKPISNSDGSIVIKPFYFVQIVPLNRAHFLINVNTDRGATDAAFGTAHFEPEASTSTSSGWFIAAHETGHAGSLPDEYTEPDFYCSYGFPSFACNTPGDPFSIVPGNGAMMNGNIFISLRYFWHSAEFIRKAMDVPMLVEETTGNKTRSYHIRNHEKAPHRNFTNLPLFIESNAGGTPRGKFDLYLYQLGDDDFAHLLVPDLIFDGILVVNVKIRFTLGDAKKHKHVIKPIKGVKSKIIDNYNDFPSLYEVKGDFSDVNFKHCLIYFYPRFLIDNLVIDLKDKDNQNFLKGLGFKLTPDDGNPKKTNATQAAYNVKVNAVDNSGPSHDDIQSHPHHFKVTVSKKLKSEWKSSNHLDIGADVSDETNPASLGDEFLPFFGDMVGLDTSTSKNLAAKEDILSKIVKKAIPNAEISQVSKKSNLNP